MASQDIGLVHVQPTGVERKEFADVPPFFTLGWVEASSFEAFSAAHSLPRIGKYYEPFSGRRCDVLFSFLSPSSAEISDISAPLIEIYRSVRSNPEAVLNFLLPLRPTKIAFEEIKRLKPANDGEKAGSFIFLNRTCWNGLYRVNSEGTFNVPYGRPEN